MVQSLVKPVFVKCAGTRLERKAIKEYALQSKSDSRIERESLLVVSYGSSGSKNGLSEYEEPVANSHQGTHDNGPAIPKPTSSKYVKRNKRMRWVSEVVDERWRCRRGGLWLWLIEAEVREIESNRERRFIDGGTKANCATSSGAESRVGRKEGKIFTTSKTME
jgi:hypothetical protein